MEKISEHARGCSVHAKIVVTSCRLFTSTRMKCADALATRCLAAIILYGCCSSLNPKWTSVKCNSPFYFRLCAQCRCWKSAPLRVRQAGRQACDHRGIADRVKLHTGATVHTKVPLLHCIIHLLLCTIWLHIYELSFSINIKKTFCI